MDHNPLTENLAIYLPEQKRLTIRRAIWGIVLALFLTSPLFVFLVENAVLSISKSHDTTSLPKPVSDEGEILDQYVSTKGCSCQISITFDQPVSSGRAVVAFYNKDDRLIESQTMTLTTDSSDRTTATGTVQVMGAVDSYEILDYDFQPYEAPTEKTEETEEQEYGATNNYLLIWAVGIYLIVLFFPFWIRNLTCKCREYSVGEHRILVYAGHSHFYIKIDGAKYDETVRFALFTPTVLRTKLNDGSVLEATITPTFKRIKFKVNDRLF